MKKLFLIAACVVLGGVGVIRAEDSSPGGEPQAPKQDKVTALAQAIAQRHPEVRFCGKDDNYIQVNYFGGFTVGCGIPDDDYRELVSGEDVARPFYVLSYQDATGKTDYELVYGPNVPKDAQDVDALRKAGAVLDNDEIHKAVKAAVDLAWQAARKQQYASEQKAIDSLKAKLFGGSDQ